MPCRAVPCRAVPQPLATVTTVVSCCTVQPFHAAQHGRWYGTARHGTAGGSVQYGTALRCSSQGRLRVYVHSTAESIVSAVAAFRQHFGRLSAFGRRQPFGRRCFRRSGRRESARPRRSRMRSSGIASLQRKTAPVRSRSTDGPSGHRCGIIHVYVACCTHTFKQATMLHTHV